MNNLKFIIILFISLFLTAGPIKVSIAEETNLQQQSAKEEESLYVAKKAFEDGFYDVSLGLLERFLRNYPDSQKIPEVKLLIGRCYFQQNRFLEALGKFEELLASPSNSGIKDSVFYWIAEVHFKGNNFDKAATYYKKIIDEFPKSTYLSVSYYSLGWCLFQEQKYQDSLAYFKVVEERFSKDALAADAVLKIVECYYNLKDYSGLKEKVKLYLRQYAKDSQRQQYFYFYLGEADYYLNNFNEAVSSYSKAVSQSGDEKIKALSGLGLAWSYLKSKQYKQAQEAFLNIKDDKLEKKNRGVLLLGKAVLMSETNQLDQAKNTYDELIKAADDPLILAQAYLGKADALYNMADYAQAAKIYNEALERIDSKVVPQEIIDKLHYGLSWTFLKQGEFKDAIKEFQKVAKESEDKVVKISALCQIGDAYQDSGDYKKAQEAYDIILKDYPDSFYGDYVQYQLGLTLLKASNYDGAIMSFLNLKRNFPQSKLLDDAEYALGLAYFQKQDYASSKEIFGKFQQEFKESSLKPQALYLLGTSIYNLGDFNGAIEIFKNIIRLYGQDKDLMQKAEYEIADCYYQLGNENEAMSRFKALRSKYPDSSLTAEIMWWLGEYYYRHNDLTMARRYFSSLIQDFPKSSLVADAYYALGTSYAEEHDYDLAMDNFKKVISLGKSDLTGQAAVALADIYVKQDKAELGLKVYKDILSEYPNLEGLIYPKIAGLYFNLKNYTESLNFYRKSLELVSVKDMPMIQLKIAEVFQADGKTSEAIEEYLKVTYLYSENNAYLVKALLRVAEIYEGMDNFKEASNIYNRIVSMNVEEAKYAKERLEWIKQHVK